MKEGRKEVGVVPWDGEARIRDKGGVKAGERNATVGTMLG